VRATACYGRYWAYRIVDGRECWYQGRPGKPKNELFWDRAPSARLPMDQPEAETKAEPPDEAETKAEPPDAGLVAVPPEKPETPKAMPEQWRASAADQLLAFTCCWPELEESALLPQPTSEPPAWPLALLPLGLYALWWIARPRRVARAVRAEDAGRVAAAQPHLPAPPMNTGDESVTRLFVLPINEEQHVSLAGLVDAPHPMPRPGVRGRLVTG
jgi:hypothetical protein